ncbi:21738_t:CDS:2 [Entrophospora sp. SA101]|nr:21738_t:CDS:2 [Entrophospora sp. SA101]
MTKSSELKNTEKRQEAEDFNREELGKNIEKLKELKKADGNNEEELEKLKEKINLREMFDKVAKKLVPLALGHDTGDSIRRPASYCGIVGFKPSYGLISRAGVIPMASSLDTIGILGRQVKDIKLAFSTIAHPDSADLTTCSYKSPISPCRWKKNIAVIKDLENYLPPELTTLYHNSLKSLVKSGYQIERITIPKKLRDNLQITYLILCSTELVSHLNSLQGITYGIQENINITQKRSRYLGTIVKQRLLIGAYFLENKELLEKARKMRYLVNQ